MREDILRRRVAGAVAVEGDVDHRIAARPAGPGGPDDPDRTDERHQCEAHPARAAGAPDDTDRKDSAPADGLERRQPAPQDAVPASAAGVHILAGRTCWPRHGEAALGGDNRRVDGHDRLLLVSDRPVRRDGCDRDIRPAVTTK
jgi:hypothetical protein